MTNRKLGAGKYFLTLGVTFLMAHSLVASGSERKFNKDWSYYSEEEVNTFAQQQKFRDKSKDVFSLREAKRALINGDLDLARFFLGKVDSKKSNLGLVKDRYLATLYFIEGRYKDSYSILSTKRFSRNEHYREVCMLRIINLMALDDLKLFQNEVANCRSVTFNESINDQFWLTQVTNIKERNRDLLKGNLIVQLRNALADRDYTKAWMKLALFLNREDVIIRFVSKLPPSAYSSKGIRELIGFAYYRLGETERALEFIEDIESPNADNIRGTANLLKKKYELAFGHFKLALQKKDNSANALERGIPLSYLLGLWDEGIKMLRRVVDTGLDERKKLALEATFNIRKEDFERSRALLNILEELFKKKMPVEVNLMDSYVALREKDNDRLKMMSAEACRRGDGLNCYLNLQTIHWENLGQTLERDEKTRDMSEFNLEALRSPATLSPLTESVIIDQRDIEELDSNDVSLKITP